MDNPKKENELQFVSRRDALKAFIAAGGAATFSALPAQWEKPLVKVGALPAFAQTSPAQYPFTNEIESIEFEGPDSDNIQFAVEQGWIILNQTGNVVGAANYPWIIGRPWLRVKRKFEIFTPPGVWGALSIKVKIKIKFKKLPGFGSSNKPADNVDLSCFALSGANLGLFQYYVKKFKVKKNKIDIDLGLPLLTTGFWPFYLSCAFLSPITLINGSSLFPGYYVGPGIFGRSVKSSFFR